MTDPGLVTPGVLRRHADTLGTLPVREHRPSIKGNECSWLLVV